MRRNEIVREMSIQSNVSNPILLAAGTSVYVSCVTSPL